ncbi:response regulator transcription factor [Methylophaga sp.]|uniref:response regulator transcription factor n=1 Tax=Methylophaga sp. TaxID=2024840 RepID=UPI0027216592|nr:response regulator transcription factor [Methylophaga sp.]MDO8825872.1 response regulator transcription factor [Methylophaga sp.]
MNILIVEDDQKVADFLYRGLKAEGYFVSVVHDGDHVLHAVMEYQPRVMILDRMLPNKTGLEICQLIRAQKLPVKILMLSAMGEVNHRIEGLRNGADDYLTKPFAFEELLARIESLANRANSDMQSRLLQYADLEMDLDTMQVRCKGVSLELTAKEFRLLELLMASPEKVFSRERILTNVWDANEDPLTNVVDVYIRRLRRKIDEPFDTKYIKTLRGVGYCLAQN